MYIYTVVDKRVDRDGQRDMKREARGQTKDLFAGLAQPARSSQVPDQVPDRSLGQSLGGSLLHSTGRVDHMAATRRLRVKLRRAQSHSPEEVKAGRLICRHLLAMLDEAQEDTQEDKRAQARVYAAPLSQRSENDSVYAQKQAARS